jgi:hypothetical protein
MPEVLIRVIFWPFPAMFLFVILGAGLGVIFFAKSYDFTFQIREFVSEDNSFIASEFIESPK